MADLSDVLAAIQTKLVTAIYPTVQTAGNAVTGFDVAVGIGWPDDSELDTALAAGRCFIAIYPLEGERNTTAYEYTDIEVARPPTGFTVTFDQDTATAVFSGVAALNDVVGVVYGNVGYYFAPAVGTTALQLVAQIAAALPASAATAVYNALKFTNSAAINVVVSNNGYAQHYLGTIERRIQISMWAFDQASRDTLFALLQRAVMDARFLPVPIPNAADYEQASIVFASSVWSDKPQNAGAYMRSLIALVSFPITAYEFSYAILFPNTTLNSIQYFGPTPPLNDNTSYLNYKGVPLVYRGTLLTFTP